MPEHYDPYAIYNTPPDPNPSDIIWYLMMLAFVAMMIIGC